jgi:hypothetical protein
MACEIMAFYGMKLMTKLKVHTLLNQLIWETPKLENKWSSDDHWYILVYMQLICIKGVHNENLLQFIKLQPCYQFKYETYHMI